VPEGLLLVVWSSIGLRVVGWVGLWVQSFFYFAMGWVELKKLDPRTTLLCVCMYVCVYVVTIKSLINAFIRTLA